MLKNIRFAVVIRNTFSKLPTHTSLVPSRQYGRDRSRPPPRYDKNRPKFRPPNVDGHRHPLFDHFRADDQPQTKIVPDQWPQVPIMITERTLIFPRFTKTLEISDAHIMNTIRQQIRKHQPYIGIFLLKHVESDIDDNDTVDLSHIHRVGTFVHIREMHDFGDRMSVSFNSIRRILATSLQTPATNAHAAAAADAPPQVAIENLPHEDFTETAQVRAITQEIVKTFRHIATTNPPSIELLQQMLHEDQYVIRDPIYLCDLGASVTVSATAAERQQVMAETNIPRRLMLTLRLLKKDEEQQRLRQQVEREVDENVKQMHRKFMLTEQAKVIRKALGMEREDRAAVADRFAERLLDRRVRPAVRSVIDEELQRLRQMDTNGQSAEFHVARTYLDWLTAMPWSVRSDDNWDVERARQILDRNHSGMADVKQRILEFVAVSQLKKGSAPGRILCFHGPPGVGKTSVARSIATALNREYFRISVGGMANVAELKGHRRTYVGAMPGKIVQCLRHTQTENPLVLIDEIDKMASGGGGPPSGGDGGGGGASTSGGGGDPTAALLELLDPEQNVSFADFYLDVPVDLSSVLFVCTANVVEAIPAVLADRMELIEMSGYVSQEKLDIAERYLVPRALAGAGMAAHPVSFERAALECLIANYSSESGVRQLQQLIEKLVRKLAFRIVRGKMPPGQERFVIDVPAVEQLLGKRRNPLERLYASRTPPGVVMGLGATKFGGTAIYVETTKLMANMDDKSTAWATQHQPAAQIHSLHMTGQLGKIMRQSAEVAMTVARNHTLPDNTFLDRHRLHLHVPKAAQPKDGPSAGVTIVAALHSLALNRPVRPATAMTGELTLSGKVLPVGGIKAKTIAAKRLGVKCLILPAANRADYAALPAAVRDGMEVHFVEDYADVVKIIFE